MLENVLNQLRNLNYAELTAVGKQVDTLRKGAREQEKVNLEETRLDTVDLVNQLIDNTELVKGSAIKVMYRGAVVDATVLTAPTVKSKNLKVHSDSFDTKDGTRYTEKYNFVGLA
jgi:hypothetical protein